MISVVTGGSGSGKSEYAEQLAIDTGNSLLYYVAAMRVWDEEGQKRVERHRSMRAGKGFETLERFTDLEHFELPDKENRSVVLLECMSNLVLNEYYRLGTGAACEILRGINSLQKKCCHLMIVTNEIFSDGQRYEGETKAYLKLLGEINRELFKMADSVTEVVYGIPVKIK